MRPAPARLQWLVAALLFIGALPLALSATCWYYGVLLAGAVLLSWRVSNRPVPPRWLNAAVRVGVMLCLAWVLVDWRLLGRPGVLVIAHFLVLLTCCKLFESRRAHDLGLLLLVSLMLLLVAGIVSAELLFPLSLAGFILLGPYAGLWLHLQREQERARELGDRLGRWESGGDAPAAAGSLGGLSAGIGLGCALLGVAFFVLFPRFSGRSTRWLAPARSLTGFSGDTNLDVAGSIAESDELVMRVEVTRNGRPVGAGAHRPYLRGFARNSYERVPPPPARPRRRSYAWPERDRPPSRKIRLAQGDEATDLLELASAPDPEHELRYDIVQQRRLRERLFVPYPPLAVYSPQLYAVRKYIGDQSLRGLAQSRSAALRYSVWVAPVPTAEQVAALAAERQPLGRPTPHPAESIPVGEPVREYALQLWQDAGQPDIYEPEGRVRMLEQIVRHLRSERFVYTLEVPQRPDQAEPVEHFLFTTRQGHCEIYATTMAVLCHILGIPTRYVTGYLASNYNEVAQCFVVRQKDAHAWVEAFVPGRDWVRYDPTPLVVEELPGDSLWGTLQEYVDHWRYQWINLVVSYDAVQRQEIFSRFLGWVASIWGPSGAVGGSGGGRLKDLLYGPPGLGWGGRLLYWLVGVLACVLAAAVLRLVYLLAGRVGGLVRRGRRGPPGRVYYERLVKALAPTGHQPVSTQTPREFVEGVVRQQPVLAPAGEVVERYYAIRYGRRWPGRTEELELTRLLGAVEAAARR